MMHTWHAPQEKVSLATDYDRAPPYIVDALTLLAVQQDARGTTKCIEHDDVSL